MTKRVWNQYRHLNLSGFNTYSLQRRISLRDTKTAKRNELVWENMQSKDKSKCKLKWLFYLHRSVAARRRLSQTRHRVAEQQVDFDTVLQLGGGRRDVVAYVWGMRDLPRTTFRLGYVFVYMLLEDANNMT